MKVVLSLAAGLCILSLVQATISGFTGKRGSYNVNDYDNHYHGIGRGDLHKYNKGHGLRLKGLGGILGRYYKGGFKGYGGDHYDDSFYGGNGIGLRKLLGYFGVTNAFDLLKYYGIDIRKYIGGGHYGHDNDYFGHGDGHYGHGNDYYGGGNGYHGDKHGGNGYHGGRLGGYYRGGKGGGVLGGRYHGSHGRGYGGILGSLRKFIGGRGRHGGKSTSVFY